MFPLTKSLYALSQVRRPASREVQPAWVTPADNLGDFLNRVLTREHPEVLDLGRPCGDNIQWMIEKGIRVHIDDRITPLIHLTDPPPVPETTADPGALDYPAGFFDGILCWDLFDFVTPDQAGHLVSQLDRILKPRGLLFALFNSNRHSPLPPARYQIDQNGQLESLFLSPDAIPRQVYENREIQDLFSGFETVHSCFLRSQTRELLLQKKISGAQDAAAHYTSERKASTGSRRDALQAG